MVTTRGKDSSAGYGLRNRERSAVRFLLSARILDRSAVVLQFKSGILSVQGTPFEEHDQNVEGGRYPKRSNRLQKIRNPAEDDDDEDDEVQDLQDTTEVHYEYTA